ncbi:MAG TPA: 4-deoxy-4-formamido-L-arabinose-phosphoundecaprenol deformylase [Deltaproteobacteria bacterium]|nr:4-deoxy-4-formamido-L-arabinose-phosphoundecaprenol deformylase [Deltaproteobacteria bacterium]
MSGIIGIKVDVDTFEGMRSGVPVLLDIFQRYDIKASFFVPMGKDNTGRTVKRVFTRKGFLKKAGRVGVLSTYGAKTLMYGLVLPGPQIARKNITLVRKILDAGHELGIHGYDHVRWHDSIKHFDEADTRREVDRLLTVYRMIVGEDARSFAAPGWMINPFVLQVFEEKGLVYSSDTRGMCPFYPEMGGNRFSIVQIPTTLPTLDEVIGVISADETPLVDHYLGLLKEGINILTVHTELEGKRWSGFLAAFLEEAKKRGFSFTRLIDIAREFKKEADTPICTVEYGSVPGRAGEVCCQAYKEQSMN